MLRVISKKRKDNVTSPKGESQDARWQRCVKHVKNQNKEKGKGEESPYNPYAVCTDNIGKPKEKGKK